MYLGCLFGCSASLTTNPVIPVYNVDVVSCILGDWGPANICCCAYAARLFSAPASLSVCECGVHNGLHRGVGAAKLQKLILIPIFSQKKSLDNSYIKIKMFIESLLFRHVTWSDGSVLRTEWARFLVSEATINAHQEISDLT